MGLLDKAKAQAEKLATKAQEGVKTGQAKLEEVQAKRKADALLRDLGAAVFAEKTGNGTAETAAEIERLVAALRDHETEHGTIDTSPTAADVEAPGSPAGGAATASEGGEFSLDDV